MKSKLSAAFALVLALASPAFTHRLDEYLQATMLSLEENQVQLTIRLIPGVSVSNLVLAAIDTNRDGTVSAAEGRAYAESVLHDLSLAVDGRRLTPRLVSTAFPEMAEIKEGLGEIRIDLTADLPPGDTRRELVLENHHNDAISVYLVNCLAPRDPRIRVLSQNRNRNQSVYQLDYVQSSASVDAPPSSWTARLTGAANMFRLGMRHIAEGTDHLLFLLVLLVPSTLLSFGARWGKSAGVRHTLRHVLKVVTAFTLGHSLTLALAAFGIVTIPNRPVEVLIAVSIFVSAVHAIRPLFPGREPAIAAFFGLVHGLAFATTLGQLGLENWARLANVLAFNAGIESMQLVVVAATLPSLLLLSGTREYTWFRIGGAVFAGVASAGWITERLLSVTGPVDLVVNAVAHRAVWLAGGLFAISTLCWWLPGKAAQAGRNRMSSYVRPSAD